MSGSYAGDIRTSCFLFNLQVMLKIDEGFHLTMIVTGSSRLFVNFSCLQEEMCFSSRCNVKHFFGSSRVLSLCVLLEPCCLVARGVPDVVERAFNVSKVQKTLMENVFVFFFRDQREVLLLSNSSARKQQLRFLTSSTSTRIFLVLYANVSICNRKPTVTVSKTIWKTSFYF